jgi:hypothetical protein
MAELRLVGVSEDGRHLVLADDSGDQHTIEIDERLRAGVNGHLSRLGQLTMALESRISPREIQERVRAGESAEHVAITAGVPLERVLRFVGPVLREREHVADQARRARLGSAGGPSVLLSDVVARVTNRQSVDDDVVAWDSARREDHSWVVIVTWPDGSTATWALDLLRHQATPVDATARKVSGLADESIDALRRSIDLADSRDAEEAEEAEAAHEAGEAGDVTDSADSQDDNVRTFVPRAVALTLDDEAIDTDSDTVGETGAATVGETGAATEPGPDDEERAAAGPNDRRPPATPRSGRSSRRARVPKWDDIMFGPKSKD